MDLAQQASERKMNASMAGKDMLPIDKPIKRGISRGRSFKQPRKHYNER